MNLIKILPINNKFSKNKLNKTFSSLLSPISNKTQPDHIIITDTSSTKTILENENENKNESEKNDLLSFNTNTETQYIDTNKIIPIEERIGYNINLIFESVSISLDGSLTCNGYITLDVGVWIITYGINFTTGFEYINVRIFIEFNMVYPII